MISKSRYSVAVIRDAVTWFASGDRKPESATTPEWAPTNIVRAVMVAGSVWFPEGHEGTMLWQCEAPVDTRVMVETLRERGCKVPDSGHETGWFRVSRPNAGTVHLGIGPMIQQARTTVATLSSDAPESIARNLAEYADLTGAVWRGASGMAGCAAIRATYEHKPISAQPLWRWDAADGVPGVGCSWELRGSRHNRPLTETERLARYVHQFDVSAMYLAAANVAMLGWSAPEPRGAQEFDPGRPGYWQVLADELVDVDPVVVRVSTGKVWLTTPVMTYLHEQGLRPEVFDSWTSERGGRYYKPWAERMTAALRVASSCGQDPCVPCVLSALKDTYARTVGMLGKPGGRIFRPDHRDEVVDRGRINVIRKVDGSGLSPLRWNVDSVWIATDEDATTIGRRLRVPYDEQGREIWQVGKFRLIGTTTPAEYLAKFGEKVAA